MARRRNSIRKLPSKPDRAPDSKQLLLWDAEALRHEVERRRRDLDELLWLEALAEANNQHESERL